MRNIDRAAFENLESALLLCLTASKNGAGLRLAPPAVEEAQIEFAAVAALSVLFADYVKPENVQLLG